MQEYCYRSSRRDATKALVKLLINNLRKRKITQMKQRYLHPQAALNARVRSLHAVCFIRDKLNFNYNSVPYFSVYIFDSFWAKKG